MKNQMIMKNMKWTAVLLTAAVMVTSCNNNDVQSPSITVSTPTDGFKVQAGNILTVSAAFEDDGELNQYKIDFHGAQDGHTHGKLNSVLPVFDTIIVGNLSGKNGNISVSIPIPNGIWPGPYDLLVFALDQSGNESHKEIEVTIVDYTDTLAPTVILNNPSGGASLGNNVTVDALIGDKLSNNITDGAIDYIEVLLVNVSNAGDQYKLGDFKYNQNNYGGAYNDVTGQFFKVLGIPSSISAGNYYLVVRAVDMYFNKGEVQVNVSVQ